MSQPGHALGVVNEYRHGNPPVIGQGLNDLQSGIDASGVVGIPEGNHGARLIGHQDLAVILDTAVHLFQEKAEPDILEFPVDAVGEHPDLGLGELLAKVNPLLQLLVLRRQSLFLIL